MGKILNELIINRKTWKMKRQNSSKSFDSPNLPRMTC